MEKFIEFLANSPGKSSKKAEFGKTRAEVDRRGVINSKTPRNFLSRRKSGRTAAFLPGLIPVPQGAAQERP
jgi:hypothetical protein